MGVRARIVCGVIAAGCGRGRFEDIPDAPADAPADVRLPDAKLCVLGSLPDDFDSVPSWATPYQQGEAAVVLGNGALRVTLGTNAAVDSLAGLRSKVFDFREQRFVVEVTEMVNTTGNARAYICLASCEQTRTELISQERGILQVELATQG